MRTSWIFAFACLALSGCSQEPLDVAPHVDLARFQGKWYEIAKLPRATQANCTVTTAFYTLREGGLDVANECHLGAPDGELKSRAARATVTDTSAPAKLSLEIAGFSGDYWILEVGEQYEYAVVGVPSRDYLWILSRTWKLDQGRLDGILQRLRASKFDTTRLEYTLQVEASGNSAPEVGRLAPVTYGCSSSQAPIDGFPAGLTLAMVAALAGIARRRAVTSCE